MPEIETPRRRKPPLRCRGTLPDSDHDQARVGRVRIGRAAHLRERPRCRRKDVKRRRSWRAEDKSRCAKGALHHLIVEPMNPTGASGARL